MRSVAVAVLMVPLVAAGCSSKEKEEAEPFPVSQPLAFDPTEQYELAAWWSNGEQLLFLGKGGFYAIYEGNNRYRAPVERGRWWQHSYAALWLEPYQELDAEATRVGISKVEGELVITVRGGSRPMSPLDGPPQVVEDRLIGVWQGALGRLRLDSDLRYTLSVPPDPQPRPAALAGHHGSWRVEGEALVLQPDSPSTLPLELALRRHDETIVLQSVEGVLRQASANAP